MNSDQLLTTINVAEGQLAAVEARLCLIEACVRLADVTIAKVRQLALERGIVPSSSPTPTTTGSENLSEVEFAKRVGVSVRTVVNDRKYMTEGTHFHRHGRRVIYHFPEGRDFLREHFSRGAPKLPTNNIERLAIDEVTQRRARVALRKARGAR